MHTTARWLLAVLAALTVCGCPKKEAEAPPPPTMPGAPPGPGGYTNPAGAPPGAPPGGPGSAASAPDPGKVLAGKVKSALAAGNVAAGGVTVEAADGALTLSGTVASDALKAQIEKVAKGVKGVTSVTNNLKVGATK